MRGTIKSVGLGLLIAAGLSTAGLAAEIGRIKTAVGSATVQRGTASIPAAPGVTLGAA